jgi:hypothetical protein
MQLVRCAEIIEHNYHITSNSIIYIGVSLMVRLLFFLFFLFFLSFKSYSVEFFDSKININDCFSKLQSELVVLCKFNLAKAYQTSVSDFSIERAREVQIKYGHFFNQFLTSEKERLNFAVESMYYLANKGIIKPIMLVYVHNNEPQLSVSIRHPKREKVGYGIILSNNKAETLALLNQLTSPKKIETRVYSKEIEKIFAAQ